jgi:hypothetical protein
MTCWRDTRLFAAPRGPVIPDGSGRCRNLRPTIVQLSYPACKRLCYQSVVMLRKMRSLARSTRFAQMATAASLAAYDAGAFCYEGFGVEGGWSFWGDACIPKSYVEKRWSEMFEVLDYVDDPAVCEQNVIAVRKREKP